MPLAVFPQRRWLIISNACRFYGKPRLFIILAFQEEAVFDVQHIYIVAALLWALSFGGRCAGCQCTCFCARFRFCRCGSFLEFRVEIVACTKRTFFFFSMCRFFCSSTERVPKHTIALLMCCRSHSRKLWRFSMLHVFIFLCEFVFVSSVFTVLAASTGWRRQLSIALFKVFCTTAVVGVAVAFILFPPLFIYVLHTLRSHA